MGFKDHENFETKRVYLKTEHGCIFHAKLCNADTYTYFECKTWEALCKAYAFEPNMVITFDICPEDDIEGNTDIWVDVQMPPVKPLCKFLNHIYVFDIVYSKIVVRCKQTCPALGRQDLLLSRG